MEKLNFPKYNLQIKSIENKDYIFEPIRKKWLLCTPEEWVRVNCINYIVHTKRYPPSLIGVEHQIDVYGLKKRFDILIYNTNISPFILIECKSPSVKINQKTFDQIIQYNLKLKCPYLMITNGLNHYVCNVNQNEKKIEFLDSIPFYSKEK
tara:strand:- start:525 stop:977 length:453 start_codon:yes stop_codon:yes gene_type:complete